MSRHSITHLHSTEVIWHNIIPKACMKYVKASEEKVATEDHKLNVAQSVACNKYCNKNKKCNNKLNNPVRLDIRVSKLTSAGMGCFAVDNIAKGQYICEYLGEVILKDEEEERIHKEYIIALNDKLRIDSRFYGNYSKFINHQSDHDVFQPNTVFVKYVKSGKFIVAVFATENIHAGQELFVNYFSSVNNKDYCSTMLQLNNRAVSLEELMGLKHAPTATPVDSCHCMIRVAPQFTANRPKRNCIYCVHVNMLADAKKDASNRVEKAKMQTSHVCLECGINVHPPSSICWLYHKGLHRLQPKDVEPFRGDQYHSSLEHGVYYTFGYNNFEKGLFKEPYPNLEQFFDPMSPSYTSLPGTSSMKKRSRVEDEDEDEDEDARDDAKIHSSKKVARTKC